MKTITISDALYERLNQTARSQGLTAIDQLLEQWEADMQAREQRRLVVDQITLLRDSLEAKYGVMSDSVELIREDRERGE
jgi:hypothetical protein